MVNASGGDCNWACDGEIDCNEGEEYPNVSKCL